MAALSARFDVSSIVMAGRNMLVQFDDVATAGTEPVKVAYKS